MMPILASIEVVSIVTTLPISTIWWLFPWQYLTVIATQSDYNGICFLLFDLYVIISNNDASDDEVIQV